MNSPFKTQNCPGCRQPQLIQGEEKGLFGLYHNDALLCKNCGAILIKINNKYKLVKIHDKKSNFWRNFQNRCFTLEEWGWPVRYDLRTGTYIPYKPDTYSEYDGSSKSYIDNHSFPIEPTPQTDGNDKQTAHTNDIYLTELKDKWMPLDGSGLFYDKKRPDWRKQSHNPDFWRYVEGLFFVICIVAIIAFVNIEPISSIKDMMITFIDQSRQAIIATSQSPNITQVKPIPEPVKSVALQKEQLIQYALQLINQDRIENGLTAVILGNNIAAQNHADDMMTNNYFSHWGADGLKPYMRYTLAGGSNYEAENEFITSTIWSGRKDPTYTREPKEMVDEAEESFLGSPGHRTNILNKWHKKVNLGIAYDKDKLYLVQQFEGDYIKFSQLPILRNGIFSANGETIGGFIVDGIQIWYDQTPHTLTKGQLDPTNAYNSGTPIAFLRPQAPPNSYYKMDPTPYTWEIPGTDPYSISADIPPAPPTQLKGLTAYTTSITKTAVVPWIDALQWGISGKSFAIEAEINSLISQHGKGVYTIHIWGNLNKEPQRLTNYSIFIN